MMPKKVLVVGGARGIGRSATRMLTENGYAVTVIDSAKSHPEDIDIKVDRVELDITDRDVVRQFVDGLKSKKAYFYAVIISAGAHSTHPVAYLPDDVIDRIMDVNFNSHVKFVRNIIPLVEPGGRIVGVSSVGATVGLPMSAVYSASKGALELFYEALSTELVPLGICAVIIQPGNVNTGFNETGNSFHGCDSDEINGDYRRFVASIESRYGMSPDVVGRTIVKAVTAKKPRLCYIAGQNALKAYWARRLLGRTAAVKLLRRYLGFRSTHRSGSSAT